MQWPWRRASCASRKGRVGELRPLSRLLDLAALARYPREYAAAQRLWVVANRQNDLFRGGAGLWRGARMPYNPYRTTYLFSKAWHGQTRPRTRSSNPGSRIIVKFKTILLECRPPDHCVRRRAANHPRSKCNIAP